MSGSAGRVLLQCLAEQTDEPVPVPLRCFLVVHEMAIHRKPMLGILVRLDSVVHTGTVESSLQALTLFVGEGWINTCCTDVNACAHLRCEQVRAVGSFGGQRTAMERRRDSDAISSKALSYLRAKSADLKITLFQ